MIKYYEPPIEFKNDKVLPVTPRKSICYLKSGTTDTVTGMGADAYGDVLECNPNTVLVHVYDTRPEPPPPPLPPAPPPPVYCECQELATKAYGLNGVLTHCCDGCYDKIYEA